MSNQDVTTHKFAAVLNKKVDIGKIMNALAHATLGLAATASPEELSEMGFVDYIDKDGNNHRSLSKNSYVILRAENGNQIRTARNLAEERGVHFIDFTHTMQEGTYLEQLEKTKETPEAELDYYALVLFGSIDEVSAITKKFQLWH